LPFGSTLGRSNSFQTNLPGLCWNDDMIWSREHLRLLVVPAQAGTQWKLQAMVGVERWIPACAGMTGKKAKHDIKARESWDSQ